MFRELYTVKLVYFCHQTNVDTKGNRGLLSVSEDERNTHTSIVFSLKKKKGT